jgi:hypothetical protein
MVLAEPTTHGSVVVRHIPDSRTRFAATALIIVDFPALGRPAKPRVSIAIPFSFFGGDLRAPFSLAFFALCCFLRFCVFVFLCSCFVVFCVKLASLKKRKKEKKKKKRKKRKRVLVVRILGPRDVH